MAEERCVSCGDIIPEGSWTCNNCLEGVRIIYRGVIKKNGVEVCSATGTIQQIANWADNNIRTRGNCEIQINRL